MIETFEQFATTGAAVAGAATDGRPVIAMPPRALDQCFVVAAFEVEPDRINMDREAACGVV
jgi:hypothetical protein